MKNDYTKVESKEKAYDNLMNFLYEIGHGLLSRKGNILQLKILGNDSRGLLDRKYTGNNLDELLRNAWLGEGYDPDDVA